MYPGPGSRPVREAASTLLFRDELPQSSHAVLCGDRGCAHLARQSSVSQENVDLHELVARQAVTGDLTGLFNHRRFHQVVETEVGRSKRFDQDLAS